MSAFGGKAEHGDAELRPSPPPEVFLQISASLFVRDLEHFFGRGYLVAIVYSPNEGYVLVHGHCSDPKSLCVTQGIARIHARAALGHKLAHE